jgi:hypothetical protein
MFEKEIDKVLFYITESGHLFISIRGFVMFISAIGVAEEHNSKVYITDLNEKDRLSRFLSKIYNEMYEDEVKTFYLYRKECEIIAKECLISFNRG